MEKVTHVETIRLSKSSIGNEEKKAVLDVLDREYLGMGMDVKEFEDALTSYFGRPCVCVVNGTAALQLALQAAGVGYGDEILVQSLTYVASFQAITATGAKPIPCDVVPTTLTLDWKDAERRISSRTKAVMPVHYAGGMGELEEIYNFADRHKLRVIEDAAHAFGSIYCGRRVGGFGDIACFSFDGIKNITSGEGGCVVSNDLDLLNKVRDARLLGVEKDTEKRYEGKRSWEFAVTQQGWRYHMSNIMAAIGKEQLKKIKIISSKRQQLAKAYQEGLQSNSKIKFLDNDYENVVPHIFPVFLPENVDRSLVASRLELDNIQTGIHYKPNHFLDYYKTSWELPITEKIFSNLLSLPMHFDLSLNDVDYICKRLKIAIEQ